MELLFLLFCISLILAGMIMLFLFEEKKSVSHYKKYVIKYDTEYEKLNKQIKIQKRIIKKGKLKILFLKFISNLKRG